MAKRFVRIGKWTLFVLGALLALSPLGMGVLAWRAEKGLDRALKEIAARGEPVNTTQLAKPSIPDKDNAALIYQKAFDAMRPSEASPDWQFVSDINNEKASLADPAVAARANRILRHNSAALRLIHQASAMPRCDWRLDWSKGNFISYRPFIRLRNCSRLLGLESRILLYEGRVDEAMKACAANFRLANAADERPLIPQLVRFALISMAVKNLSAILRDAQPSAAVCRAFAAEIRNTDLMPSFVRAVKGERALGLWTFNYLRSSPNPRKELMNFASGTEEGIADRPSVRSTFQKQPFLIRWWLASDELTYLKFMDRFAAEARLPYRTMASFPSVDDAVVRSSHWWRPCIMTMVLVPSYSRINKARDRATAHLGLAQVSLLLKAYRAERSEYPASLAELARSAGYELPIDPFSGKPFAYRREGAGFLLYSWGQNLKDDGGKPPAPFKGPEEGDIVVRGAR